MKLNINCIRDILFEFESLKDGASTMVTQEDLHLDQYDVDEVTFHLYKINQSNCGNVMFSKSTPYNPKETYIVGLTDFGYKLVASLHHDDLFNEFKEVIDANYPIYDLEIFSYAYHSYLSTKYGFSTQL